MMGRLQHHNSLHLLLTVLLLHVHHAFHLTLPVMNVSHSASLPTPHHMLRVKHPHNFFTHFAPSKHQPERLSAGDVGFVWLLLLVSISAQLFCAFSLRPGCSVTLSHALAFRFRLDFAAFSDCVSTCMPCVGATRTAVPGPGGSDNQHDGPCVE